MLFKTVRFRLNQNEAKRFFFTCSQNCLFISKLTDTIHTKTLTEATVYGASFKTVRFHLSVFTGFHLLSFHRSAFSARRLNSVDGRPKRIKKYARFQAKTH